MVYAPVTVRVAAESCFSTAEQMIIRHAINNFEYCIPFFKIEISFDLDLQSPDCLGTDIILLYSDSQSYIIKSCDAANQRNITLGYWLPGNVGTILLVMDRLQVADDLVKVFMHEMGHAICIPHINEIGIMHPLTLGKHFFNKNDAKAFAQIYNCNVDDFRYFKL